MRRRQPRDASRRAAMSGTSPTMKKTVLIDRYVEIANTSQTSGDRKFGQRERWFGYGRRKYANHMPPAWISGNKPAVMTAQIVKASAARKDDRRQRRRTTWRIAQNIEAPG